MGATEAAPPDASSVAVRGSGAASPAPSTPATSVPAAVKNHVVGFLGGVIALSFLAPRAEEASSLRRRGGLAPPRQYKACGRREAKGRCRSRSLDAGIALQMHPRAVACRAAPPPIPIANRDGVAVL